MSFVIDRKSGASFWYFPDVDDPTPVTPVPSPDQKPGSESKAPPPASEASSKTDWLLYGGIALAAIILIIKVFSK